MNTCNLIPPPRRARKAGQRAMRRWTAICSCHFMLLAMASIFTALMWRAEPLDTGAIAKVRNEISRSNAKLASLRLEGIESQHVLQTAQEISEQPDWSNLMLAIAKSRGDDIILSGCELSGTGGISTKEPGAILLRIEGIGFSEEAISAFVLRLQGIPVLDHVKLVQTSRKQTLGVDAFAFQVTSSIGRETGGRRE